jgi:hypothetical protein
MATTAISSTANQADSITITIASGASIQVTSDRKLQGDESVILLHAPDGANFIPCNTGKGCGILDAGSQRGTVNGPGDFRLRKSATAGDAEISYDS